ncbi:hypothetical protein ACF0H5_016114 [Mactra antiquata]
MGKIRTDLFALSQLSSNDWPMTDGDYIRNVDYKDFDPEKATLKESSRGAFMIAEMLRQEYKRDFKLEPSTIAMNNVEAQSRIAWEIEKVKEEMGKVRIIQQAWYDDYRNNKYINDISLADIKSCGFGDAPTDDKKQNGDLERSLDAAGIVLVRNVSSTGGPTTNSTLIPRSRYLVPSNKSEVSGLTRVSM